MDENIDGVDERRRDLLKKAGLAAGAVWAAPVVASNLTPAGAQAGSSVCAGQSVSPCGGNPNCGSTGPLAECYCAPDVNNSPVCVENAFCGGEPPAPCPPGFELVTNCCGTVCTPVCGTGRSARREAGRSGLTGSGEVL
jgi:hypothetical protein